jgi:DNA-dependent RNA polymerase auxiliary subunit epsilon
MNKYFVVFTEESTKDYGYYVEAESKEDAYDIAEEKYYSMEHADSLSTTYSKTLGHEVEVA